MKGAQKNFIILKEVDSTNNYAMGLIQKGLANGGDAIFALEQTSGKGRRGKSWESVKGQNIVLSILSEMQWLPVHCQFQLSIAAAMACHDFFSCFVAGEIKIKWPNDVFINDRKAGGILIENVIQGRLWQWSVIGIGLNINQENFETSRFNPVSLKQLTGKAFDVQALAQKLHENVVTRITDLQNGGFNKMYECYNQNLFARNKKIKLKKGNITFETTVQGVSFSGELITRDAMERTFGFDEVEWL